MRRLFLLPILLAACHGSPTEPHLGTGSLTGRVLFAETNAPAVGARVVAHLQPGVDDVEARTDAGGRYSFQNLLGGQYFISAYAPGSSDRSVFRSIGLVPGQNVLDLQISANQCAWITGIVRDGKTHSPIAGATVTLLNLSATTASDGSYTLALGCPPPNDGASHLWSVEHPLYQRRQFPIFVPSYSTTMDVILDPL